MPARILESMLLAAVLGAAGVARADGEVGIFPVHAQGVTPREAAAIGAIFAAAYADVSTAQVVPPADTATVYERAGGAAEAANVLALFAYVELDAVREAGGLRVGATLYDRSGAELYHTELLTRGLEDFDRLAPRLAAALFYRRNPQDAAEPMPAAQQAAAAPDVLFPSKVIGFKLEVAALLSPGAAFDPTVSVLFAARLEAPRWFVEIGGGGIFATQGWNDDNLTIRRIYGITAELGAGYYFLLIADGEVGFSGGGGFLPRLVGGDFVDTSVKMALYGQLGGTFLRKSSTTLYADLRVAQNLLPYLGFDGETNTGRQFYPTEVGLNVGIGW